MMQAELLWTEMVKTARLGDWAVVVVEVVEARVGEFGCTNVQACGGRMMG